MGRSPTKVEECGYSEYDRRLTEQFIYGLDDEGIIGEILREVTVLEDYDDVTNEWVLFMGPKGRSPDITKRKH